MNLQCRLSSEEAAFAAENHYLLLRYLRNNHLPEEEYYDELVFGFLNSVCLFLRNRNYTDFEQLAIRMMDIALERCERARDRDFLCQDDLEELVADVCDTAQEAIASINLERTMSVYSEEEKQIASLLMNGYGLTEIAAILNVRLSQISTLVNSMRIKTAAPSLAVAA